MGARLDVILCEALYSGKVRDKGKSEISLDIIAALGWRTAVCQVRFTKIKTLSSNPRSLLSLKFAQPTPPGVISSI
jgi:hypothetical protein